jgi:DNA-binding transcriptional regulator YiaG
LRTEENKQFRSKMKLSQKDASILFGGASWLSQKYERGEQSQSRSTDILMKLLLNITISLDDIKKVKCV